MSGDPFIDAKAEEKKQFQGWMKQVNALFLQRTCCDWAELCGDDEPVRSAFAEKETPEGFVDRICTKFGLVEENPRG
jgi:hypothetical protein